MRAFIILGVLAAANAAGLGYNYGPGVSGTVGNGGLIGGGVSSSGVNYNTGLSGGGLVGSGGLISGGGLVGSGSNSIGVGSLGGGLVGGSSYGGGSYGGGSLGGGLIGGGSIGGGSIGGGLIGGSIGGGSIGGGSIGGGFIGSSGSGGNIGLGLNALNSVPQTVEYTKQYFHYTAPEDHHAEGRVQQQLSNVLKKNLQVVFIKAPENNAATNAALQLAKQAIEQRTAIYVLTKENDASNIVGQLQQIQESVPTAPEVRFIKYRTAADIANAKQAIQAQYNSFGGSSQVINGGVAPVLNYASGSGSGSGGGAILGGGIGGGLSSGIGSLSGGGSLIGNGGGSYTVGGGLGSSGLGSLSGTGSLIGTGGSSYTSGTGSLIGGGSSYGSGGLVGSGIGGSTLLSGVGNTNQNYLPPSLRK